MKSAFAMIEIEIKFRLFFKIFFNCSAQGVHNIKVERAENFEMR